MKRGININILLIGGSNSLFFRPLVDKLKKEKHKIFHIAGKKINRPSSHGDVITFNIDLNDDNIGFVIKSVSPGAIVYLGAFDSRHIWKDYHRSSAKYISELTNVLVAASDLNVEKFIYLSSLNVYGFKNQGVLNENTPFSPSNIKSIILAQGERLCLDFSSNHKINTVCLRFGLVYGALRPENISSDYIMAKCLDTLKNNKITVNNRRFSLIHVNDAAIAVYKAISLSNEKSDIYNICDDDTISDEEICDIILDEYSPSSISWKKDDAFEPQDYTVDGSKFKNEFAFFQNTKYKEGIKAVAKYIKANFSKLNRRGRSAKDESEKNGLWYYIKYMFQRALPFLETTIVFIAFVILQYISQHNIYFKGIDFLLYLVVLASATFGKKQALVSTIMAMSYFIFEKYQYTNGFVNIFTSVDFISRILFLFVIGITVGHTRDRLYIKLKDSTEYAEFIENEYVKLDEINNVTIAIKEELEDRLLTYTDSLATNYSIINNIDVLLMPNIYANAIESIKKILSTKSVSIYIRNTESEQPVYNIALWTNENSRKLGNEINLFHINEFSESFYSDEGMFTNNDFKINLPIMASAIKYNDKIDALIMIWDMKFEALTMHSINLFTTLTKIISKSVYNAHLYNDALMGQFSDKYPVYRKSPYYIYDEGEFLQILEVANRTEEFYGVPFSLIYKKIDGGDFETAFNEIIPNLTGLYSLCVDKEKISLLRFELPPDKDSSEESPLEKRIYDEIQY